jgi:uncharacterized glyoxalase superfamily protein PhnB
MAFKSLAPNLMVEDVTRAITFYREVLGFAVATTQPDEGTPIWAMLSAGGVTVMFQARQSLEEELPQLVGQPIGASQSLYIGVDDADALYASIRDRAHIIKEPHTAFYGAREFYIQDTDGYILCFASDVAAETGDAR